jgi:hypothetical protein
MFDQAGQPKETRADVWSYKLPDDERRFIAMLSVGPIAGPRDAVTAATVAKACSK